MLSTTNRFRGRNSLRSIYRYGQSVSCGDITLRFLNVKPGKAPRVAVVVSRKVDKRAVVRNKIRRRIYELTRAYLQGNKVNIDLVLVVNNNRLAKMESSDLGEMINNLLDKGLNEQKK